MYMRISRGTFDPGSMSEEQFAVLIQEVADAIKTQPGFASYQGAVNWGAGTLVAVSTWQDEDSANFPREALGAVVSKIMDLGIRLEAPEIYDVRITV
jgi:quinol monooxygenase YgiN